MLYFPTVIGFVTWQPHISVVLVLKFSFSFGFLPKLRTSKFWYTFGIPKVLFKKSRLICAKVNHVHACIFLEKFYISVDK